MIFDVKLLNIIINKKCDVNKHPTYSIFFGLNTSNYISHFHIQKFEASFIYESGDETERDSPEIAKSEDMTGIWNGGSCAQESTPCGCTTTNRRNHDVVGDLGQNNLSPHHEALFLHRRSCRDRHLQQRKAN